MEFNFSPIFYISVHLMEIRIFIARIWVTKSKVRFMEIVLSKEAFVHSYSASHFFNCTSSFPCFPFSLHSSSLPGSEERMHRKERRNQEQTYFINETSLFTEASLVICPHCLWSIIKMIHFVFVLITESCIWISFFR